MVNPTKHFSIQSNSYTPMALTQMRFIILVIATFFPLVTVSFKSDASLTRENKSIERVLLRPSRGDSVVPQVSTRILREKEEIHYERTCEGKHPGDSCDDGIFCNGEEVCDNDLKCVSSDPPCTRCDEICDEEYQECLKEAVDCRPINSRTPLFNPDTCRCEFPQNNLVTEILDLAML